MKRFLLLSICLCIIFISAQAQIKKFTGPKFGVTLVQAGSLASILRKDVGMFTDEIKEEWNGSTGMYGSFMSQYGWQWESHFADGGNVTGIVEWIALVGGVEKGMLLPSLSSMVGLRNSKGIQFSIGPELSLGGIAMIIGAGYNFKFGELNLPVKITYIPSQNRKYSVPAVYKDTFNDGIVKVSDAYSETHPTGARVSIMVGFNLSK